MKMVEASLVLPLSIAIICGLIVMTLDFFTVLYEDAGEKHMENVELYDESLEETIRLTDRILSLFEE
ncbi:MAG: hypothetical protein MJ171_07675 [Clostridia bacterium]|nr:hypothetical protein [Clostridia bacterium]